MGSSNLLLWMILESFILGAFLYLLLRLRPWLGNTPLVVTLGTFQFIQVLLAISLYFEVLPGLLISPGSTLLFTGTILGVLLLYIVDDAIGARKLIYSLLLANILLSLITYAIGIHMTSEAAHHFIEIPREIFIQNPRIMIIGTITLFLDTILVIMVYEFFHRVRSLFLRMGMALSVVLIFDSLIFVTGSFFENQNYLNMLYSSIIGKLMMIPSAVLAVTMLHKIMSKPAKNDSQNISDVFNLLTYRQKYESAKNDSLIDSLTKLYNRRAFNLALDTWNEVNSFALMIIDVDDFKHVNDRLGHSEGDKVLKVISSAITSQLRGSDVGYRYGGEEFVVFMPFTTIADAVKIGEKIHRKLKSKSIESKQSRNHTTTLSIGIAAAPKDGMHGDEIFKYADQRLYSAKSNGKNQTVSS